jgi:Peptidase family C25
MTGKVDKLLVTNGAALTTKYGTAGLAAIKAAVTSLIAADLARGLTTRLLFIDDAADMATVSGAPVGGPSDERSAKAAVDAASTALSPDYIVLLDGPDVVPHITLSAIPGLTDADLTIPSDLPYASSAGWSRQAARYLAITRVVGRLPAAPGVTSADGLVRLIAAAAAHRPLPASQFAPPLALSADDWKNSTQTSINAVFGPGTSIDLSPPATHPAIDPSLARLAHFINCHGAAAIDEFYGQLGSSYPLAMKGAQVSLAKIGAGAVVAAECCYGAELYDFTAFGASPPICLCYLDKGAIAFLGSTTIAYGPAIGNGQADLLTQYFMSQVLAGASTGRAFLRARQDFIRTQVMAQPDNLKTIAQFILLGDPSCQPCSVAVTPADEADAMASGAVAFAAVEDPASARKTRRIVMASDGAALADAATRAVPDQGVGPELEKRLQEIVLGRGFRNDTMTVLDVTGGASYRAVSKQIGENRKMAIAVETRVSADRPKIPLVRVLVAHILEDRIIRIHESESR